MPIPVKEAAAEGGVQMAGQPTVKQMNRAIRIMGEQKRELVDLRAENGTLNGQLGESRDELRKANTRIEELEKLVSQLQEEADGAATDLDKAMDEAEADLHLRENSPDE